VRLRHSGDAPGANALPLESDRADGARHGLKKTASALVQRMSDLF
jgi:hypothetical protein